MLKFRQFLVESEKKDLLQLDAEIFDLIQNLSIIEEPFWQIVKEKCVEFFTARGFRITEPGRNRIVFLDDNHKVVIKVPLNDYGLNDNEYEYRNQNNQNLPGKRAKSRMLILPKTGLPILVMEKLDVSIPWNEKPDWANYYDSQQIGVNRKGVFKAYDYGRY